MNLRLLCNIPHLQARQRAHCNVPAVSGTAHSWGISNSARYQRRGIIFRIGRTKWHARHPYYNDGSGAVQEVLPEIRPIGLGAPVITIGRHPDNIVVSKHPQVSPTMPAYSRSRRPIASSTSAVPTTPISMGNAFRIKL